MTAVQPFVERPISRKKFITSGLVGGAFILGLDFAVSPRRAAAAGLAAGGQVTVYIRVNPDETITIVAPNSEMGQGTSSALPQVVAEELMVDWSRVRMELAGASAAFANPLFRAQVTGGSSAVRGYHDALRVAGAAAREMLIAAAAKKWGVAPSACTAQSGVVKAGALSATYGELAAAAALLPPPANPPLTDRSKFRLIGTAVPRLDIPDKVNGAAVYGIDVRVKDMVYAAVKMAPKVGQTVGSVGRAPSGMTIVNLGNAVAVVTPTTTWQAIKAARSLSVTWVDAPTTATADTAAMAANAAALLETGSPVRVALNAGDAAGAVAGSAQQLTATYNVPYLPHATMEPMNATALVASDRCEVWAPTQNQAGCVSTAMSVTGLPAEKITVHTTFLGGGLGRKVELDYVRQALLTAKAVPGKPVKLTWSREDDFTHDYYRPAALCRLQGGVDAKGNVTGLISRIVSPSIGYQRSPARFADPAAVDSSAVEGLSTLPYTLPSQRVEWIRDTAEVPVGYWRSVGNSHNVFFAECFVDELAAAAKRDPIEFRKSMLGSNTRAKTVLDTLAQKSGWASPLGSGRARGVALSQCFGSIVGEVVEVSGSATSVRVTRVTVVIDCGSTINPDTVRAQVESAVLQGLAAALWGDMPFAAGQPLRTNFNQYRLGRLREAPPIDVTIVESGAALGGVGEPALPPVAPALVNAWAKLGADRKRTLPLFPQAVPTAR
jgi:isoquinoline 1-oxidoreductase beta subunit